MSSWLTATLIKLHPGPRLGDNGNKSGDYSTDYDHGRHTGAACRMSRIRRRPELGNRALDRRPIMGSELGRRTALRPAAPPHHTSPSSLT